MLHALDCPRPSDRRWAATLPLTIAAALIASLAIAAPRPLAAAETGDPLTIVVMDPLAAPLACDCVKGYAQRRYEKLGAFLEKQLQRPVKVAFAESIEVALRGEADGKADLIIGKSSVVKFDAAACKLKIWPLAMLTGKDGLTTQTGLIVVAGDDPAKTLADLVGYKIFFGPPEAEEKHAAALAALRKASVPVPEKPETRPDCADAALTMLESDAVPGAAAVISSYAAALLEGCGTIDKGSIRIVGRTEPVPFVTVFANAKLDKRQGERVLQALLAVREDPQLLVDMESKTGFVAMPAKKTAAQEGEENIPGDSEGKGADAKDDGQADWPSWRGPRRDAIVPWLPDRLPDQPNFLWKAPLTGMALAGVTATAKHVIVADRDMTDSRDVFRCLDAETGLELWKLEYPARGELDYGNSARAAPLVHDGNVYLLSAFGDVHCVGLADGEVAWKKNLRAEFGPKLSAWGMCSSPLIVDGKLILNPGAKGASIVALDPADGKLLWKTDDGAIAYSSFIVGRFGGRRQLVGYDAVSLGGWDIATGRRLWKLVPPEEGDFNVPTPIDLGDRLLVTTENNGTRLYGFDTEGRIRPEPLAVHEDLAPDTSTPVVVGGKLFGCWGRLFCLDLDNGLAELWTAEDEAFDDYVSLIADRDRVLITTVEGELLLVRADGARYDLISRMHPFGEDHEVMSHPAMVGRRLYIRNDSAIGCLLLE